MTTEVTASLMIGSVSPDSAHGKSALNAANTSFCPSHVMVLVEGNRATWVLQECPALGDPSPPARIRPQSPEHLLAAAVLGFLALFAPVTLLRSPGLESATAPTPGGGVEVGPIDRELAVEVFSTCAGSVDGVLTVMPGSSITDEELRIAARNGLQVAVTGSTVDTLAVTQ